MIDSDFASSPGCQGTLVTDHTVRYPAVPWTKRIQHASLASHTYSISDCKASKLQAYKFSRDLSSVIEGERVPVNTFEERLLKYKMEHQLVRLIDSDYASI